MSPDLTSVETSVKEGFGSGALTSAGFVPKSSKGFGARFFNLNYAGRCDAPVETFAEGMLPEYGVPGRYRAKSNAKYRDHNDAHLSVRYLVPCRACGPCLRRRAWHWATAGEREIKSAASTGLRTWFSGGITLSPANHFVMLMRAERIAGHLLTDPVEEFAFRHRAVSRELTLALKRFRKRIRPRKLRYLLVAEKHESGLPHYHMLMHEVGGAILKSELNEFWPLGFCQWRLVRLGEERKGARYVAKYLSKSAEARVRASQDYGGEPAAWSASSERSSAAPVPRAPRAESGVATVNTAPETREGTPRRVPGLTINSEPLGIEGK